MVPVMTKFHRHLVERSGEFADFSSKRLRKFFAQMPLLCRDFICLFTNNLKRRQEVASVEPKLNAKQTDQNKQQDGGKLQGKHIGRRIGFRQRDAQ